ncbi:MAG TPA: hypothetical protein VL404_04430 [Candidatus Eisenbacteria bacterium]|nr:hypothetical protein [Candidatus Eisenbacteria bacterium]
MRIGDQKGSVFVTTMVATLLMLLTGGYMYTMADQGLYNIKQLQYRAQAKYIADAGLADALGRLRTTWATSASYPSTTLAGGTYQASVTTISGRTKVTATATANGVTQVSTAEVVGPGLSALDYVFAAGGDASIDAGTGQSSGTINGDMYSGGDFTLDGPASGGTMTVTGDIQAAGNYTDSGGSSTTVNGTATPSFSTAVAFPTVDYSYYQTIAQTNGYYVNGNVTYASGAMPASPAGGVIYVNGDVTINGTQNTNACIVATGSITISKTGNTYAKVTITRPATTPESSFPAAMCQGNFTWSTTGNGDGYVNITGLIYTQGNFTVASANHETFTLTGSVVAAGNINLGPTAFSSVTAGYSAQTPPGFTVSNAQMQVESYNS